MYTINEEAARAAKNAMSFDDYKTGSATAEYNQYVQEAQEIAERQKKRVDPMYHEKIDYYLDMYCRKLAQNLNDSYRIGASCPSVMIAGGSNFPVRKKQKQIAAMDRNYKEYNSIQDILKKIESIGTGGISSDDKNAVEKLQKKLDALKKHQEVMKEVNAYYRKNKTIIGCACLSEEEQRKAEDTMLNGWHGISVKKPFETWELSNNNANIHRIEGRIEELKKKAETDFNDWQFEGGEVVFCKEDNRLRVLFDEKPEEEKRNELKSNGFRWSPKNKAWQRQITTNAIRAAKMLFPEV